MAISSAQKQTLSDARTYEVAATWFTGAIAVIAAITLGISIDGASKGGIAFAVVFAALAVWCNRRRAEYKADIKYLQEQEGLL